MAVTLPPFAPFPEASWGNQIAPAEWEACLDGWIALIDAHLSLPGDQFSTVSCGDESISHFLSSLMREVSARGVALLGTSQSAGVLLRRCTLLTARFLRTSSTPPSLLSWEFLADFARVCSKKRAAVIISGVFPNPSVIASLGALKKSLILALDSGPGGDPKALERQLKRLNHLIYASPDAAALFLAGSDFLDGLISCYTSASPPLRKTIITTAYLCLVGLTEGGHPKFSMLADQLYSLKTAAEAHRAGPLDANDAMVAELVTATPILKQVDRRLEASGSSATTRIKSFVAILEGFRKPGGGARPKRPTKRRIDKGKGIMTENDEEATGEMRLHQMSQISQVQDLFPELGSGFVSSLLDEYGNDTEQVIAHLLEDNLPPHLASADRTKQLSPPANGREGYKKTHQYTSAQLPVRDNVFDDDEFDRLSVDPAKVHFGKWNPDKSADDILNDRSSAPTKASILSALSAFDADDDERDDTYDAADAGFVVNDGTLDDADDGKIKDANEEVLFRAYQSDPKLFARDAVTRRGAARAKLKQETKLTDEAIEGWAVMLARAPNEARRLEIKYSAFRGDQPVLSSTAWRANPTGPGTEESDADNGDSSSRGGFQGRGRGRGRGRGGDRGRSVSGPAGDRETENARRRKEANKGARANHNRRNQRAKKMARGGFPG
ncbi:hypothetical protein GGS23DRAFT_263210 [Durotheca rogersii]|uniref:uncharacterized protein n=1 Tax=Durotheca rogersii TaxID=419775 RepID=UPI00222023D2|nr:uncharacterized protein GGS23DRAFT_263210 [Durotheca rogersii]KAI5859834.1 hypothetical protein GGS23DRAFT_263210 [Durotheca rogersii]